MLAGEPYYCEEGCVRLLQVILHGNGNTYLGIPSEARRLAWIRRNLPSFARVLEITGRIPASE